jgi:hypothetical protein
MVGREPPTTRTLSTGPLRIDRCTSSLTSRPSVLITSIRALPSSLASGFIAPRRPVLRELRVRYAVKKDDEGRPIMIGRALTNPSESASLLMTLLQDEPAEVFAILCLTTKHRVIATLIAAT